MLPEVEVTFIARGRHLQAIRRSGLQVHQLGSEPFAIKPCRATDNPQEVGIVDIVLVCVKSWQVPEAAEAMHSLVGENTAVVPLQNGLDSVEMLRKALGPAVVCGGLCRVVGYVSSPGVIEVPSSSGGLSFGGLAEGLSDTLRRQLTQLKAAFQRAGVAAMLHEDTRPDMWAKFINICVLSGMGSVTRVPIGQLKDTPESWQLVEGALREGAAVAAASGVDLGPGFVENSSVGIQNLASGITVSMQRDIMAGRPSELDAQVGAMVRVGAALNVPTPIFSNIYAMLLPMERAARAAEAAKQQLVAVCSQHHGSPASGHSLMAPQC